MPEFNDAFWRWFGDSKVVDARGNPLVMYHGSPVRGIKALRPGDITGLIWTSASRKYADGYAHTTTPSGKVYPVYVRAERIFDYRRASGMAIDFVEEESWALDDPYWKDRFKDLEGADVWEQFVSGVATGNWMALEVPEFVAFVHKHGFDGWFSGEGGVYNIAVFEPEQIKSATGNDGSWDIDDPDITSNPPEGADWKKVTRLRLKQKLAEVREIRNDNYERGMEPDDADMLCAAAMGDLIDKYREEMRELSRSELIDAWDEETDLYIMKYEAGELS